jgi:hypothetical protein
MFGPAAVAKQGVSLTLACRSNKVGTKDTWGWIMNQCEKRADSHSSTSSMEYWEPTECRRQSKLTTVRLADNWSVSIAVDTEADWWGLSSATACACQTSPYLLDPPGGVSELTDRKRSARVHPAGRFEVGSPALTRDSDGVPRSCQVSNELTNNCGAGWQPPLEDPRSFGAPGLASTTI